MLLLCLIHISCECSAQDRFVFIEKHLKTLADSSAPGLKETVKISVTEAPLSEFIRALARSNNLNISIDQSIDAKLTNNFSNESVANILLFLCKSYDLDIHFIGSILSIVPYKPPPEPIKKINPKEPIVFYNVDSSLLTLELYDDTLEHVAKKITQLSGRNVIVSSDIRNKLVSIYLQDLVVDSAIKYFASANFIELEEDGELFILQKKQLKDVKKNQKKNQQKAAVISEFEYKIELDEQGEIFVTAYAQNVVIQDLFEAISKEASINYFVFTDLKGSSTVNVVHVRYDDFLSYLFNETDFTFKVESGIYMIGNRLSEGLSENEIIQLQYRSAENVETFIPNEMKQGVQIKLFLEQNSLILSGSKPQINEIKQFIKKIDQLVPIILIEVLVIDVDKNKILSTGLSAGVAENVTTGGVIYPDVNFTVGAGSMNALISILSGNGIFNLGNVSPNFYANIRILETNGTINISATPRLATLNGHTASMSIGETEFYLETTQNVIGSLNPQTVITEVYKSSNVNLSISINPVVSGDDQITLDITVDMSSFTGKIAPNAPRGNVSRSFKSMIRIKNEEMIVLGGLYEKEVSETGSGLPILSRIPIIKWLFSQRTKINSTSKLDIFIKPTILY